MSDVVPPHADRIGYGNPAGPWWFVAWREPGSWRGRAKSLLKSSNPLDDLGKAHQRVIDSGDLAGPDRLRALRQHWAPLVRLLRSATEAGFDVDEYLRFKFGRAGQRTLLAFLAPIPDPELAYVLGWAWEEPGAPPRHDPSRPSIRSTRVPFLRGLIERHRPEVVVHIGREHWPVFQELYPDTTIWEPLHLDGKSWGHLAKVTQHLTAILVPSPTEAGPDCSWESVGAQIRLELRRPPLWERAELEDRERDAARSRDEALRRLLASLEALVDAWSSPADVPFGDYASNPRRRERLRIAAHAGELRLLADQLRARLRSRVPDVSRLKALCSQWHSDALELRRGLGELQPEAQARAGGRLDALIEAAASVGGILRDAGVST